MSESMNIEIYSFLQTNNISYQRFDHPAVFTCEQAEQLCPEMPGAGIKNLFLFDKKTDTYYLVVVRDSIRVDLKKLQKALDISHLSFASSQRLMEYLGVEPGSVTLLGIVNDIHCKVQLILDVSLQGESLQCHPLVNTATLVIAGQDIERFIKLTGHELMYIEIPERLISPEV